MLQKTSMKLNNYIEHTLLKPDTTIIDIKELCQEALTYEFSGVCIPPFHVKTAAAILEDTPVRIITTVGYPMGYHAIPVKVEEAKRAIDEGVDEIEMVVNIAAIKDANWAHVRNDINSVTTAAHLKGKKIKVILETGLLTTSELKQLCEICCEIEVDYIKNATGINSSGVSLDIIAFLKKHAGDIKLIAAGGIHSKDFAIELIEAGVSNIGTASGVKLVK